MPEPRRRGGIGLNLLISAASLVVLLAPFEIAVRWIDPKLPLLMLPSSENCLRRSGSLSLEFRPDCSGVLRGTSFSTNSAGMRGPELRDDGSIRILAVGDSCTWGWRVAQDQSYPAVLQRVLDGRTNPAPYQVLNAGVPGYTSYQGLVYLREKGLALKPGVIIAGFGFNDANELGDVEEQIAFERRFLPLMRLDDLLLQRSLFYRWMRWRTAPVEAGDDAGSMPAQKSDRERRNTLGPRVPLTKYVANLDEIARSARDQGARLVLLSFWPESGGRGGRRMALQIVADKWDIPLLVYEGERFDLVHPTVDGYRRLAERIAAELEARGDLK